VQSCRIDDYGLPYYDILFDDGDSQLNVMHWVCQVCMLVVIASIVD